MIQLKDGIHGRGMETKTIHLVEALEKALDSKKNDIPNDR
jgi:hypothetical protein